MTCKVWEGRAWKDFLGIPVLMERNNYRVSDGRPNQQVRDAQRVAAFMAKELGIGQGDLCDELGLFFRQPQVAHFQPNNIRGHAFRSLIAQTLASYGDSGLTIREEQPAHSLFPGHPLGTRSTNAKIDIVVTRKTLLVALISTRWTYRHDRVDLLDEAHACVPPARRQNPGCVYYGVVAEFGTARLKKVISQTDRVQKHAVMGPLVHLNPELAGPVIGRDGQLTHLMSLADFVRASADWR
jgi:hypothetical protein